ncbi:MmcQ/YjbR family DNA-binding protein [Sorangium sp. So ce131]|uniref:MmcQ/YjbR family DNA-binding protein n=1 Tax=Sorangium sp. So ce131 TaxID=3133282 RepID=UPI003F5F7BAE
MNATKDDARFTPVLARLRDAALAYPESAEEFPWGDRVFKVRGKIFAFLNTHEGKLIVTAKLPESGKVALMLPFAEPTGYNLGKSGWVTARFGPKDDVPEAMMLEWIEESYGAVAPKRLSQALGSAAPAPRAKAAPAKRAAAGRRDGQGKAAAPSRKAAAPSRKAAAPSRKAAAPSRKAAAPSRKAAAPSRKAAAPAKPGKKNTPAKAAAPGKKTSPARRAQPRKQG